MRMIMSCDTCFHRSVCKWCWNSDSDTDSDLYIAVRIACGNYYPTNHVWTEEIEDE